MTLGNFGPPNGMRKIEPEQSNSGHGFDFDATSLVKKQNPGKAKYSRGLLHPVRRTKVFKRHLSKGYRLWIRHEC